MRRAFFDSTTNFRSIKAKPGSYGYELLALMEDRHYKYIVNYTKGSFYYNLQQLEEKQYIKN